LQDAGNAKAVSIRGAMEAAAGDLGVPVDDIVPVCLDSATGVYNIDAVWGKIAESLPEAKRQRLVRTLEDLRGGPNWSKLWSQTLNAGRVIARAAIRR
jgi:hypothetical protein